MAALAASRRAIAAESKSRRASGCRGSLPLTDGKNAVQPAADLLQSQGDFHFGQAMVRFPQGGLHVFGSKLDQQVTLANNGFLENGHVDDRSEHLGADGDTCAGVGDNPTLGRDPREWPARGDRLQSDRPDVGLIRDRSDRLPRERRSPGSIRPPGARPGP